MKIIDAGHCYELDNLDGFGTQTIQFVKRIRGHVPGIIIQQLLRIIIDRLKFLNNQVPCYESSECILLARRMLILLESRACRRKLERNEELEYIISNTSDGHVFFINEGDTKP